jgi:hypothetical protein
MMSLVVLFGGTLEVELVPKNFPRLLPVATAGVASIATVNPLPSRLRVQALLRRLV